MKASHTLKFLSCLLICLCGLQAVSAGTTKEIIFLAGKKSHGYGAHEHRAGSILLARCLNDSGLDVKASVVANGAWPEIAESDKAPDAIVMYCDGGPRHIAKEHQDKIQKKKDKDKNNQEEERRNT